MLKSKCNYFLFFYRRTEVERSSSIITVRIDGRFISVVFYGVIRYSFLF